MNTGVNHSRNHSSKTTHENIHPPAFFFYANVDGRVALKIFLLLILGERWGRGKERSLVRSCRM